MPCMTLYLSNGPQPYQWKRVANGQVLTMFLTFTQTLMIKLMEIAFWLHPCRPLTRRAMKSQSNKLAHLSPLHWSRAPIFWFWFSIRITTPSMMSWCTISPSPDISLRSKKIPNCWARVRRSKFIEKSERDNWSFGILDPNDQNSS